MSSTLPSQLSFFIQCSSMPMAIANLDFEILDINQSILDLLDSTRDQLINKHVSQITFIGDIAIDFINFDLLVNGEINSYTVRKTYETNKGTIVKGIITISILKFENEKYTLGCVQIDESNTNTPPPDSIYTLSQVLALNPDIHYIYDLNKKNFVYQNIDILQYLGYTKKDLNDLTVIDFLRSKIEKESFSRIGVFNNSNVNFNEYEYKIKTKNGGYKWLNSRSTNIKLSTNIFNLIYTIIKDVTEEKEIREELKYQLNFIDQVANLLPDMIFVYNPTTLETIYSNIKDKNFLGLNDPVSINKKLLQPDEKYISRQEACLQELFTIKDGEVTSEKFRYTDEFGKEHWLLFKNKVFSRDEKGEPKLCLTLATDITHLIDNKRKMLLAKQENENIIKAIPDIIFIINKDGEYLEYYDNSNESITDDSILGKNVSDIFNEDNCNKIMNLIQSSLENDKIEMIEFEFIFNDETRYFTNHINKLDDKRALVLARDITTRKLMEIDLDTKINQLSQQNFQLQKFIEKNSELERFAYIISHDLKEPLRNISAISHIIKKELSKLGDTRLDELVNHLINSSNRMNSMIEGVLDYSKLEINQHAYEDLDLNEIIEFILSDFDTLINERDISIDIEVLPRVYGNSIQMRQLLQNLINNAIKFNSTDNPKIRIYSEKSSSGHNIFCIADKGIGIEERFRKTIFKLFRKLNRQDDYEGQGIGLSICKKIVDNHQGEIWVEDNDGGGSIFKFTLHSKTDA